MLELYRACGPYFSPLMIMNVLIVIFTVKKVIDVFFKKNLAITDQEYGLGSILFWGIMSALLGTLGQLSGIYNALTFIVKAPEINPHIIAEGFTISFVSTLWGLFSLLVSAFIWYILKSKIKSRQR